MNESGGSFEQSVTVGAPSFHVLPGQSGAFVESVQVNGKRLPVLSREGRTVVHLDPGEHEIEGNFTWKQIPETLYIGDHTAFLSLSIEGRDIPLIKREDGNIWLKGLSPNSSQKDQPEQLELLVFRRLMDGSPLVVETRLVFQVSGKARELTLDDPLLPGTAALGVEGDLAMALEPSGALRVQLLPGRHEIRLTARALNMPSELRSQNRAEPWPSREIWTWLPQTELRSVAISGAPGIDASRTELPEDWRADSAYTIGPSDVLKLTTTRRAEEQIPSNHLSLRREFWLDEKASHFTVRDALSGEVHQKWRVDLLNGELGQVKVAGESQVITQSTKGDFRGVEVRDAQLDLVAVSRVPRTASLAAVGWSEDVDSLSASLHLPPGWDLLFATGVDQSSDSWLARWNLFSVFYVLVMTLAMARLTGVSGAAITASALVLAHEESGAPEYIWVILLVLAAVLGLLKEGRFYRLLRGAFHSTSAVLLVLLVSFSVDQVRGALYPHLNAPFSGENDFTTLLEQQELRPTSPAAVPQEEEAMGSAAMDEKPAPRPSAPQKLRTKGAAGIRSLAADLGGVSSSSYEQRKYQPDAIVQTGPGIPEISGRSWDLSWSGPVDRNHQLHLYLLSPNAMRGLTFLRLILLFGLGFLLLRLVYRGNTQQKPPSPVTKHKSVARGAAALIFFCIGLGAPHLAQAEEPSDARLAQLKEKLSKPPACSPECLSVASLKVNVGAELVLESEVHVGALAAYKLPGPATALSEVELRVDGKPATAVRLEADGAFYLRLSPGVHRVELRAQLRSDRTTLDVGTSPRKTVITSSGWMVTGIDDLGRVEGGTLTFHRTAEPSSSRGQSPDEGANGSEPQNQVAVPPFFVITRSIDLGVSAKIKTHIERRSDPTSPELVRLKLLKGEHLTTPGVLVKNGEATISFPRQSVERELSSTLELPTEGAPLALALAFPEGSTTSEIWELRCGVVWHCSTEGVVATSHVQEGSAAFRFHPWPGEVLTISAEQARAAAGQSLTVRKATLTITPGSRLSLGRMEMLAQTSRATLHTVTIPKNAKLESAHVDGKNQAVKSQDGKVQLSLLPGVRKIDLKWQEARGLSTLFRSPHVDAGAPGVNFRVVVELPTERWLLLAGGPSQGPAILLWGYLILIVAAALLLPLLPYAPLKRREWLLLGLGLTQVPVALALFVGGWFFAVGSRNAWPIVGRKTKNFLQFLLVLYSIAFVFSLTGSVYEGLVSSPDMEVRGAGSYNTHLVWFSDRRDGAFPPVWDLSVSIWVWRAFMLAWALWLSKSLLKWLKWAWLTMSVGQFWLPGGKVKSRSRHSKRHPDAPPNATQEDDEENADRRHDPDEGSESEQDPEDRDDPEAVEEKPQEKP